MEAKSSHVNAMKITDFGLGEARLSCEKSFYDEKEKEREVSRCT